MRVVPILDLPHRRARALIQSGAPVWVAVNPVEYHGPHLSLHNDQLIAYGLIRECHLRLLATGRDWPLLFVHDLEVGVDPVHGPGSRHTPVRRVRELVIETTRALVELGAKSVVFMTFHGSPRHAAAIEAGVRWARAAGVPALSPLNLVLREMLTLDPQQHLAAFEPIPAVYDREGVIAAMPTDTHAGYFETSVALAVAPHAVDDTFTVLPPCPTVTPSAPLLVMARAAAALGKAQLAAELTSAAHHVAWQRLQPFPGYTSWPGLASAEAGRYFVTRIVDAYAEAILDVTQNGKPSPQPIMGWLAPFV